MRTEGQRARNGSRLPAGGGPQRWGALVRGVSIQRLARMQYVVAGLVPARIEVRPSNGLGALYTPTLRLKYVSSYLRETDNVFTTKASGKYDSLNHRHVPVHKRGLDKRPHRSCNLEANDKSLGCGKELESTAARAQHLLLDSSEVSGCQRTGFGEPNLPGRAAGEHHVDHAAVEVHTLRRGSDPCR